MAKHYEKLLIYDINKMRNYEIKRRLTMELKILDNKLKVIKLLVKDDKLEKTTKAKNIAVYEE